MDKDYPLLLRRFSLRPFETRGVIPQARLLVPVHRQPEKALNSIQWYGEVQGWLDRYLKPAN